MDPMGFGRKSRNFRPNFPKQKNMLFFHHFSGVKKKQSTPHLGNTKHFTCTFTICRGDDRGMP